MSPLTDLASLPCIGSPKLAQTIIDEMLGRGWQFVAIAKPVMIADPGATGVERITEKRRERNQMLPHDWEPTAFDP